MTTSYSLLTSYAGQALLQGFDFISSPDLSHGFVSYQNYSSAVAEGLASVNAHNQVILTADTTHTYNPDGSQGGRPSVRIESKASYNQVLVVGDFAHMPGSTCGAWPAFWMYGPNWPNDGEIDIIEGANMAYQNLISAHTSSGCRLPSSGAWTGTQQAYTDCSITDGCNYVPPPSDTNSYGDSFNAVSGGVYAMLWSATALRVWHFARGAIPPDLTSKTPDPSGWGTPQALFGGPSGACDVDKHFADMSIVLNIDFCGDYAGNTWGTGSCSGYAPTCETWVGENPTKLKDLYWAVNYIDVYSPTTAVASSAPFGRPSTAAQPPSNPKASTSVGAGASRIASAGRASLTVALGRPVGSNAASSRAASASPTAGSNPANINSFAYLGCFSSTSGYSAFTLFGTDPKMTLEDCTDMCSSSKYAAVANTQCYCADSLDSGTASVANRSSCNTPCPGNSDEYCGSSSAGLRSLYINNEAVNSLTPPPAPAMAGNARDSPAPQSQRPQGAGPQGGSSRVAAATNGVPSGDRPHVQGSQAAARVPPATKTVTLTSEVIYATVCSTDPAHLVTITTTVTYCPDDPSQPSVPQSTVTQSCNGCGIDGQSQVTLTVPLALVSPGPSSQADPQVDPPVAAADPEPASQAASQVGLQATPVFPVNGTTGAGSPTWTPIAAPTYSEPVQVASAPRMSGWSVAIMSVACIYGAMLLI